jgi:hypothetical protein
MTVENGRAERAPLIHRSTSVRAIYTKDDDAEAAISTTRGACIVASIGILVFLQGQSQLESRAVSDTPLFNFLYCLAFRLC